MAIEIERKFISNNEFPKDIKYEIKQGYLLNTPEKIVRIRIKDTSAYLTIKIPINDTSKEEYEYLIPYEDGINLLQNCESILEKTRYVVDRWEIDVFHGQHNGLILAEIELLSEDEIIDIPSFIEYEVTGDIRYYNSHLIKNIIKNTKENNG